MRATNIPPTTLGVRWWSRGVGYLDGPLGTTIVRGGGRHHRHDDDEDVVLDLLSERWQDQTSFPPFKKLLSGSSLHLPRRTIGANQ
jgi:hypothetical protein